MDWQQIASLSIVGVTAMLLGRHQWQKRQRARLRPCGGDCGCQSSRSLEELKAQVTAGQGTIIKESLDVRGEEGERSRPPWLNPTTS